MAKASIIICATRPEAYAKLRRSLDAQTEQDFEVITITERGPLAGLRNRGLRQARAPVVCFIDDDTVLPPRWLASVLDTFRWHPKVVGVTGPPIIPIDVRAHRDLFRWPLLYHLHNWAFLGHPPYQPGHIYPSGAFWPPIDGSDYEGPCDFLEACNMAYRTEALQAVGGFDESYTDLGEWSEPDAGFRLQQYANLSTPGLRDESSMYVCGRPSVGAVLWYTPTATLVHRPARGGATLRRRVVGTRLANVELFHRRWVRPCWQATCYRAFLRGYFGFKWLQSVVRR